MDTQRYQTTQKQWPGIASQLRTAPREMREKEKDWPRVAAFYAEDFFQQPALQTFQELQKAAERAGVWPAVRAAAMHYLETGELPQATKRVAKGQTIPPWPLPDSGVQETTARRQTPAPMIETLIDIAIAEKRPDEVIRWYDQRKPRSAAWGYGWQPGCWAVITAGGLACPGRSRAGLTRAIFQRRPGNRSATPGEP